MEEVEGAKRGEMNSEAGRGKSTIAGGYFLRSRVLVHLKGKR